MEMKIQNEINKHIKGRNKLIPRNLFYKKQGNNRQIDSRQTKKYGKRLKHAKIERKACKR